MDIPNAESGYCYLALLKVGCTFSKDIHDFIDEAKANQSIQQFEETYHNPNEQYSAQPILNNWRDNKRTKEGQNEGLRS